MAGCAAGILGLTGLSGFVFYAFSSAIVLVFLLLKMQFQTKVSRPRCSSLGTYSVLLCSPSLLRCRKSRWVG